MTRLCKYLLDLFKRNYPLFCTLLIVCNFVASCSAWRSITPRHFYHSVTNTVYCYSVVTQYLASSSVPLSPSSDTSLSPSSPSPSPVDYPCNDYVYFLADGRKCARLWGRVHFVGSLTSRGRIVGIFPDRCVLDNGNSITNEGKRYDRFTTPATR